jgi:hypothetical protein
MTAMPVNATLNTAHHPIAAQGDKVRASAISRDAAGTIRINSDAVLRGVAMSAGLGSTAAINSRPSTGIASRLNRRPNSPD